jgi:hypothetical protein
VAVTFRHVGGVAALGAPAERRERTPTGALAAVVVTVHKSKAGPLADPVRTRASRAAARSASLAVRDGHARRLTEAGRGRPLGLPPPACAPRLSSRSKVVAAQNERSHVRSRPPGPRQKQRLASTAIFLAQASAQSTAQRVGLIIEVQRSAGG